MIRHSLHWGVCVWGGGCSAIGTSKSSTNGLLLPSEKIYSNVTVVWRAEATARYHGDNITCGDLLYWTLTSPTLHRILVNNK